MAALPGLRSVRSRARFLFRGCQASPEGRRYLEEDVGWLGHTPGGPGGPPPRTPSHVRAGPQGLSVMGSVSTADGQVATESQAWGTDLA